MLPGLPYSELGRTIPLCDGIAFLYLLRLLLVLVEGGIFIYSRPNEFKLMALLPLCLPNVFCCALISWSLCESRDYATLPMSLLTVKG